MFVISTANSYSVLIDAKNALLNAIRYDEKLSVAHYNLGAVPIELGEYSLAVDTFKIFLILDSKRKDLRDKAREAIRVVKGARY